MLRNSPSNIDAEKSVLGSMFLSKYALDKACESLDEEVFYDSKNAKIFKVLKEMNNKKIPIDLMTITNELTNQNLLNSINGVEYLTEVMNSVATATNIDYYIEIVENAAIRRKLIFTTEEIAENGYNGENDINEILDIAESKILNISKRRKTSEFKSIQNVLKKTHDDLEQLSKNKGDITGLATGWNDIDKLTSGLHENELIIIAARPAMGKTAFALNLATNIATNSNNTVAIFNLEMGAEQLANRMISSCGQIEGYKLRTGNLHNDDWRKVNEAIAQLEDTKLYIDDTPGITIGEIRSKCRRLASSDNSLGIVIIDYLQLISGGKGYGANRQQEVSDISRSLKTLAMELHIPVVALAQLSRAVDSREEKRPIMSDLRESGSLEQDADIVAFLYRDDYYNKERRRDDDISISEFIVAKHRNGPTSSIELLFKRNTSTFLNYQKEE